MYRSLLFVPADDQARLARAHERGADAIILDLEDGVAPQAKETARAGVRAAAKALSDKGARVFVRINSSARDAAADLDSAICAELSGVLAPKVREARQAGVLVEMIREAEAAAGVAAGATELIALIETAGAVLNAAAIAATPGVTGLALGPEDLCAELGVPPSADSLDLPCKQIALATAAAGIVGLGAPISIAEFKDMAAFAQAVAKARSIGLSGALCIHPAQVEVANKGFAPSEAEIAEAREVLAAWAAAGADGRAVVSHAGRMIDAPIVARARRVLGVRA